MKESANYGIIEDAHEEDDSSDFYSSQSVIPSDEAEILSSDGDYETNELNSTVNRNIKTVTVTADHSYSNINAQNY